MNPRVYISCFLLLLSACGHPEVQTKSTMPSSGIGYVKNLVASALPKEVFDLCYYPPSANSDEVANFIIGSIKRAGSSGIFIVIGSENISKQKEIVKMVCSNFKQNKLVDSKIAVIGLQEDRIEFESLVNSSGAKFIFIEFK